MDSENRRRAGAKPSDFSNRMRLSYRRNPRLVGMRKQNAKEGWKDPARRAKRVENVRKGVIARYKAHPETIEAIREARLHQVFPVKDTTIEVALQNELKGRSIVFEKHVPLLKRYQVDILTDYREVILADGCYWHSCPQCQLTSPAKNVVAKDEEQTRLLKEAGYKVFRFWEHEIRVSPSACIDVVLRSRVANAVPRVLEEDNC